MTKVQREGYSNTVYGRDASTDSMTPRTEVKTKGITAGIR